MHAAVGVVWAYKLRCAQRGFLDSDDRQETDAMRCVRGGNRRNQRGFLCFQKFARCPGLHNYCTNCKTMSDNAIADNLCVL